MNRAALESALRIMLAHRHSRIHCLLTRMLIGRTIAKLRAA